MIGNHEAVTKCLEHHVCVYYVCPTHTMAMDFLDRVRLQYGAWKMQRQHRTLEFKQSESSMIITTFKFMVMTHGFVDNLKGYRGVVLYHPAVLELPNNLYRTREFLDIAEHCNARHTWLH